MSNPEPAAIPIAPPAYVLFQLDGVVSLLMLSIFIDSISLGFASIGPPGLLATLPAVAADTLPWDFAPPILAISLFSSGPLSPSRIQPFFDETSEVYRTSLPSATMPGVDSSPVVSSMAGSSLSPAATLLDVGSSPGRVSPGRELIVAGLGAV